MGGVFRKGVGRTSPLHRTRQQRAPVSGSVRRHIMNARKLWSHILSIVGGVSMLVGAIDPMEGSLLILPGSGLVALGTFLGQGERRLIAYRVWVFILIALGVAAFWWLSALGGFGGPGRSMWRGVLILPYLIGWSMGIWGPGSPRWMLWLGMLVSLGYLPLAVMMQVHPNPIPQHTNNVVSITLAALGVLTIGGCIYRLRKRISAQ